MAQNAHMINNPMDVIQADETVETIMTKEGIR